MSLRMMFRVVFTIAACLVCALTAFQLGEPVAHSRHLVLPQGGTPQSDWSTKAQLGAVTELINTTDRLLPSENLSEIVRQLQTPRAVCFAPGTPWDVVAAHERDMRASLGPLAYQLGPRWPGSQGSGADLRWSFVPDGLFIGAGISGDNPGPSELFSRMDTLFGGNRSLWISKFQESFDRWEALTGNTYTRVTNGVDDWDDGASWGSSGSATRGDVRISMRNIDGGSSVLAFNFFPSNGDMVIDRSENWGNSNNNYRFLRNVIMHEHGHGVGLFHVCSTDSSQLMEPFLNTGFDGLQHDEVRGGQRHYGDPFEPNNAAVEATDLGAIAVGVPVSVGTIPAPNISTSGLLSIDADTEQDWFQFTVDTGRSATVTVTPQGRTYDNSTQNGDGSCNNGNPFDSLAAANLDVEIIDGDGTTVLATANAQAAGTAESLIDVFLPTAGTYYVRVFESTNFLSQSQLYTMTVAADETLPCQGVMCDDGLFCNGAEFCDLGDCFDGPPACSPGQGCDEDLDECFDLPGACCLPDGDCEVRPFPMCLPGDGHYYGNGTDCAGPLDPACVPVDTIVTCALGSPTAFAGGSVTLDMFIQEVEGLATYNMTLEVTLTSGSGSLTVDCPDAARINQQICIDDVNFEPTGLLCDPPNTCPSGQFCVARPDFVFSGQGTVGGVNCNLLEFASTLLNPGSGVTIGTTPAYLGDITFEVSGDAAPNSTFEISFVAQPERTFLTDAGSIGIPFRIGTPCVLTVLDPAGCNAPAVAAVGSRYLEITPAPAAFPVAFQVEGDPGDPAVSCVSQFVQADGTLGDTPVFQTTAEWGTIFVHDEDLLPSTKVMGSVVPTSYSVSAYCNPAFSPSVSAATRLWADVDNNTFVNFIDVQLIVLAFQGNFVGVTLEAVDIHPCLPNSVPNFADVQLAILAFQGQSYADTGCPSPCP